MCPKGTSTLYQGKTSLADCSYNCGSNNTNYRNEIFCNNWPYSCGPSSYRSKWFGFCIYCPPGYYCPLYDQLAPVICPAGTYSTGAAMVCTNCIAGYYQDVEGSFYCKYCPVGYICIEA
jgi:hypothetical protein